MSHFSRRHFGDVDIKELINHYKQYECLWNFNSPSYKSKALKQEAWTEISNYFQKDVDDLKRKVKYLRSAYVTEKRKVIASKKSGNEYKPILFYFKELDFLEDVVVWRKFANNGMENNEIEFENVDISADGEEEEEVVPFETKEECIDIKQPEINCKTETSMEAEALPSSTPNIISPKISHPRSLASRPQKRTAGGDIKLNKSLTKYVPLSSAVQNFQHRNIYISFGKTIALQLQQLPLDVALLTMSEIHTVITKKSLEHVRSLQNGYDSSHSESEESYSELIEALNDSD